MYVLPSTQTAAAADVAATLIANAVDLHEHPGVLRAPAIQLDPDSDLGARLVTTHVPSLSPSEIETALSRGTAFAHTLVKRSLITQAALTLQGRTIAVVPEKTVSKGTLAHA